MKEMFEPDSTLKKQENCSGQIGWNKKFTELDECKMCYIWLCLIQINEKIRRCKRTCRNLSAGNLAQIQHRR